LIVIVPRWRHIHVGHRWRLIDVVDWWRLVRVRHWRRLIVHLRWLRDNACHGNVAWMSNGGSRDVNVGQFQSRTASMPVIE